MSAQIEKGRIVEACNEEDTSTKYTTEIPKLERIAWVWALIFAFSAPEILTFLRSLRIYFFKAAKGPKFWEVMLVVLFELMHVEGLALLVFLVMPELDSQRNLMLCSCVCLIPSVLQLFQCDQKKKIKSAVFGFVSFLALLAQISCLIIWPIVSENIVLQIVAIPLVMISFRWWENYVNPTSSTVRLIKTLRKARSRYHTYLFLAPMKIIVFALNGFLLHGYPFNEYFQQFSEAWNPHEFVIEASVPYKTSMTNSMTLFCILAIQIFSSYICYIFSKFACKIKIQEISLAPALCLISPLTHGVLLLIIEARKLNACVFQDYVPDYLSFKAPTETQVLYNAISWYELILWVTWLCSQFWITKHMWKSRSDRNVPTEKLFVCPWYCGFLIDQCIPLNRRIVDLSTEYMTFRNDYFKGKGSCASSVIQEADKIPQVIVCATMWHETEEEIMEFLKSILRLDEDQCARRMAKMHLNDSKPDDDYYELETNIFFDDAFLLDKSGANPDDPPLNEYVKTLIESIPKACNQFYNVPMKLRQPLVTKTPYGGRLAWTLPGGTKMIAHLKNKDKIRHKKRWSQVMYMYYLLGYRIMQMENISPKRKAVIAENTFLLALDGDIDFQPQAVHLLINRMKGTEELGAACGRIHPVGRGPLVWFQKFEYAIGHWLQKATEHVIGCVLCSPGCFSVFRASALMGNNVLKKYTTVSTTPLHYVQYDQGEDRWLCTLILKQGLRIEYLAISDAYTHAPETFNEFYNQRRRWMPSSILNIFSLLADAEIVLKNNCSMSKPYIFYLCSLLIGQVLSPGTIFLMMIGALSYLFSTSLWVAFLWNFLPVFIFVLSCVYFKQQTQLLVALVISSAYCLVMIAVLVGLIIHILDLGPLAPTSVFFLLTLFQIVIAGFMHPQEILALASGFIYFITIPSTFLILSIYSVFNLNDVSWGTREIIPTVANNSSRRNSNESTESQNEKDLDTWLDEPLLEDAFFGQLDYKEEVFWKDLIKQYLEPIFHSKEKKAQVASNLLNFRNSVAFTFLMINSIFVLIVFLLQFQKNFLHLKWPINPHDYISYDHVRELILIKRHYKELDPVGFFFVLFFGLMMIVQFIAMLYHRFTTVSHLLAATKLRATSILTEADVINEIKSNAVEVAKHLQRPTPNINEESDDECDSLTDLDNASILSKNEFRFNQRMTSGRFRRQIIHDLHYFNGETKASSYSDLSDIFESRFFGKEDLDLKHLKLSKRSLMVLNKNRQLLRRRTTKKQKFSQEQLETNYRLGLDNTCFSNSEEIERYLAFCENEIKITRL